MPIIHKIDVEATPHIPNDIALRVPYAGSGMHALSIRVLDQGREVDLLPYDAAKLVFIRSDGAAINAAATIQGNSVAYTLRSAELSQPGNVACMLTLTKANGQNGITARFNVQVERSSGDIPFPSPEEAGAIEALLARMAAALDTQRAQIAQIEGWIADPVLFTGPPGKDGTGIGILDAYDTLDELTEQHPSGNTGDGYVVGENLYIWSDTSAAWKNAGPITGPPGKTGGIGPIGPKGEPADPEITDALRVDLTATQEQVTELAGIVGGVAETINALVRGDF